MYAPARLPSHCNAEAICTYFLLYSVGGSVYFPPPPVSLNLTQQAYLSSARGGSFVDHTGKWPGPIDYKARPSSLPPSPPQIYWLLSLKHTKHDSWGAVRTAGAHTGRLSVCGQVYSAAQRTVYM